MAASGATKQDQQLVLAPCSSVSPLLTSIPLPRFFLGPSLLPPSLPCTLTGWSPKPSPDLQPLSSYDWLGSWPSLPPAQKAWPRRLSPLQFRQIPVQTQSKPPSTTLSRWATHPARLHLETPAPPYWCVRNFPFSPSHWWLRQQWLSSCGMQPISDLGNQFGGMLPTVNKNEIE